MTAVSANVAASIGLAVLTASIAARQQPPPPSSAQTTTTATTTQSPFPPGPGRDALFKVCHDCHGPESVLGQLKTREEWSKNLDEMAANGAQGTDEEFRLILEYLATHYSLIFVNKADAKELAPTLDMPTAVAEAIVRMRKEKGSFKSIDDLRQVPGIDVKKLDARKDRLIF